MTEDIAEWSLEEGAININPYWLWRSFKNAYEDLWTRLNANKETNNPMKQAALHYLRELLK